MHSQATCWLWGYWRHHLPTALPCPASGALELTVVMKLAAMWTTWFRARGSHI